MWLILEPGFYKACEKNEGLFFGKLIKRIYEGWRKYPRDYKAQKFHAEMVKLVYYVLSFGMFYDVGS